jgi:hypothetical protein
MSSAYPTCIALTAFSQESMRAPPERGKNFGLRDTLKLGSSEEATVTAWGPYRIRKELYDEGIAQIDRLDRNAIAYKALDLRFRPYVATNCFHAVSDITRGPLLDTGTAYGNAASEMVVEYFSPWIINPKETHAWLIDRLGLDKYSITFEKGEQPGPALGKGSK